MPQSFFIWKGRDCRSMGVWMQGPAAIIRPEERVTHVQIPGRSGDLTQTEGTDIYNSYIQTATILVRGGSHVRDVYSWLRGSGFVTFSGEPDRRQPARIIGALTLNKHAHNIDWWTGEVQFYCQPLKQTLTESTETVTTSGATVRNNGDVPARPMYKVTANDTSLSFTVTGTGTPATNVIALTSSVSGNVYWVDSESMEVWNGDKSNLLTKRMLGDFPVLAPGVNTITGAGWSSIEIEKRERFL